DSQDGVCRTPEPGQRLSGRCLPRAWSRTETLRTVSAARLVQDRDSQDGVCRAPGPGQRLSGRCLPRAWSRTETLRTVSAARLVQDRDSQDGVCRAPGPGQRLSGQCLPRAWSRTETLRTVSAARLVQDRDSQDSVCRAPGPRQGLSGQCLPSAWSRTETLRTVSATRMLHGLKFPLSTQHSRPITLIDMGFIDTGWWIALKVQPQHNTLRWFLEAGTGNFRQLPATAVESVDEPTALRRDQAEEKQLGNTKAAHVQRALTNTRRDLTDQHSVDGRAELVRLNTTTNVSNETVHSTTPAPKATTGTPADGQAHLTGTHRGPSPGGGAVQWNEYILQSAGYWYVQARQAKHGICIVLVHLLIKLKFHFLPESVAVVSLGILMGAFIKIIETQELASWKEEEMFRPNMFFLLLLPPIIFESGYSLHKGNFFQNIGSITLFAVIGTAISAFIVGGGIYFLGQADVIYKMSMTDSFAFGSLISAVDPVATIAIFNALNVDPVLNMLVFGESILNDAVSIVLTNTAEGFANASTVTGWETFLQALGYFLKMFFGSAALGTLTGLISAIGVEGVPVAFEGVEGVPVAFEGVEGVPVAFEGVEGVPVAFEGVEGVPVAFEGVEGVPVAFEGVEGVPVAFEGVEGVPVAFEGVEGVPVAFEGVEGVPVVFEGVSVALRVYMCICGVPVVFEGVSVALRVYMCICVCVAFEGVEGVPVAFEGVEGVPVAFEGVEGVPVAFEGVEGVPVAFEGVEGVPVAFEGVEGVPVAFEGVEGVPVAFEGVEGVPVAFEGVEGVPVAFEGVEGVPVAFEGVEGVPVAFEGVEGVPVAFEGVEGVPVAFEGVEGVPVAFEGVEGVPVAFEGVEGVPVAFEGVEGCLKHVDLRNTPSLEFGMMLIFAYLPYGLSEGIKLSGIMAILFSGIVMSHYTHHNLSPVTQLLMQQTLRTVAFMCETCVFAFLGLSIFSFPHKFEFSFVIWCIVLVLVGRAVNIFPLSFLLNFFRDHKITPKMMFIMWFSGLRGAIPYALSLHLGLEPIEKRQLIGTTTIVIVLFTILLLGGGTMPLMRILDIEESQSRRRNKKDVNLSKTEKMGNTIESEHLSELTEEEYEAQIVQRQDLKGFLWLDAKYLNPFFTRRLTQEDLLHGRIQMKTLTNKWYEEVRQGPSGSEDEDDEAELL
ncbi:hypothetical protein P4O66_022214, partial [Electrophorus voltai]